MKQHLPIKWLFQKPLLSIIVFFFLNPSFSQTHEVLTADSGFPLPLEILGAEGSTVSVTFDLTQNEANQAEHLWLQVNSLDYEDKGSIDINGGGYYLLNHSTVEMQYQEEAEVAWHMEGSIPSGLVSLLPDW